MSGALVRIAGPTVVARGLDAPALNEVVWVGEERLLGEVIRVEGDLATVQVYEETSGLALGGGPTTIGVRCPDHPFVRALAAEVGPIATTSANRSGEPTPTTAGAAAASPIARPLRGLSPPPRGPSSV